LLVFKPVPLSTVVLYAVQAQN